MVPRTVGTHGWLDAAFNNAGVNVFRVSVVSFESRNLSITLVRTQLGEVLNFAPPDACIIKQKLLNTSGAAEGQAGMEALRVALNC